VKNHRNIRKAWTKMTERGHVRDCLPFMPPDMDLSMSNILVRSHQASQTRLTGQVDDEFNITG
jgi:hypothetical protein